MSDSRPVLAVAVVITLTIAGCTPQENTMTPHESRDALVELIQETSEMLEVTDWSEISAPRPEACPLEGGGDGVNYTYGYSAAPGTDHRVDARKVAEFWESRGSTVRLVEDPNAVVFGSGGPTREVSFSTAPGNYFISGSSTCVPGNANDLIDQESSG